MTGVEYAFYDESCTERRKTFFQPFKECSLTYTHNDHYGIIYNVRKKSKIKLPTEGRREIVLTVFFSFLPLISLQLYLLLLHLVMLCEIYFSTFSVHGFTGEERRFFLAFFCNSFVLFKPFTVFVREGV